MKRDKFILKVNSSFVLVLVLTLYSKLVMLLLSYYQYQINPDGISYISIAQKYLGGNFADAINAYICSKTSIDF